MNDLREETLRYCNRLLLFSVSNYTILDITGVSNSAPPRATHFLLTVVQHNCL